MPTYRNQGVYTVVGTFTDFEAGTFTFRVLDGYIAGSWEYVLPTCGPLRKRAHEARILRMAYEEWSAPDTREHDAITFVWSDERTTQNRKEQEAKETP